MKRLALTSSLLLMAATGVFARKQGEVKPVTNDPLTKQIISRQIATVMRSNELPQRLIAYSNKLISPDTLTDTSHYYYSGLHGSSFPDVVANIHAYFDDSYCASDSFFYNTVGAHTNYRYEYNADNQKAVRFANESGSISKNEYSYNSNGDIIQNKYYDTLGSGNGSYVLKYVYNYTYDNQHFLLKDSAYNGVSNQPLYRTTYQYGAGDKLEVAIQENWNVSTSSFINNERKLYTYNSDTYLTSVYRQSFQANNWANQFKDSFAYYGNNPLYIFEEHSYIDGATNKWVRINELTYTLNNQGVWDTCFNKVWQATFQIMLPIAKTYFAYNANGLVQYSGDYNYDLSKLNFDANPYNRKTYYYDTIGIPQSVAQTPSSLNAIKVFPNPATSSLHINWPKELMGQKIATTIINTLGQTVIAETATPSNSKSEVNISHFPSGIYWIYFRDETGKLLFKQTIEKLD